MRSIQKTGLLLIVSSLLLCSVSCKKDKEGNSVSMKEIAGSYTLTSIKYKTQNLPEEETLGQQEPCSLDDMLTFREDGTYSYTDQGLPCDPASDQDGTWSLSGKTFIIDGYHYTLHSYNGTNLQIRISDQANGDPDTTTETWTRL